MKFYENEFQKWQICDKPFVTNVTEQNIFNRNVSFKCWYATKSMMVKALVHFEDLTLNINYSMIHFSTLTYLMLCKHKLIFNICSISNWTKIIEQVKGLTRVFTAKTIPLKYRGILEKLYMSHIIWHIDNWNIYSTSYVAYAQTGVTTEFDWIYHFQKQPKIMFSKHRIK